MIELQAELRQLQRDVPRDARRNDRIDDAQVLAGGGLGRFERRGALAEIVERERQPAAMNRRAKLRGRAMP
jgi:hypothetical protein